MIISEVEEAIEAVQTTTTKAQASEDAVEVS